ncbi:MAG: cysteine--tRNA ligase [Verrucomicrobiota bacterium]
MLELYDTLSRLKKPVTAADGKELKFYCCGPTVYGPAHIGNFRTFLVQDLFRRVVEIGGLKTRHVRNITDVDDKTIRESRAVGETLRAFTGKWTARFHKDCLALHLLKPHAEPGAAGHIPEQIALIEQLISNGHAYQGGDGSVYYSVSSFPGYGKLTHLDRSGLQLGAAQTANDADEYDKDSLADFVLWKARKPEDGDNFWESPWGDGRPGWHLECSAMGMKYLGESFDLHGGGIDLCFPHHENEIAQSEAATGEQLARHWFHSEHLSIEGTKMSKSLGNLYTLADIEEKGFTADELRYTLLSGSYRQKLNFTFDSMHAAHEALGRLARFADTLYGRPFCLPGYDECVRIGEVEGDPFRASWDALHDDLNTAEALGQLFKVCREMEKAIKSDTLDNRAREAAKWGFSRVVRAFGWEVPALGDAGEATDVPEDVRALAEKRLTAKVKKDWATADALREELSVMGWKIKDSPEGYELEPM